MKGASPTPAEFNQLAALLNAGHHAELEKRARLLLGQYSDAGFAWKLLSAALQMQGKDSLSALQKAAGLLPDDIEVHNSLGLALQRAGRMNGAEISYRRALQIKPDYAAAHYNLGNVLTELGRLDEAVASYREALRIEPANADAHYNLGNTLVKLGQLEEAAASYRQALQVRPDFVNAHYNLGNTSRALGRLDEAAASYRRALQIKPDFAKAHNSLGIVLQELGRLDEAEASYRQALRISPDNAVTHYNLGIILQELGRLPEAAASYRQALQFKPGYAEAHNNLGFIFQELGRLDEAEARYRRAIQIKPDFAGAHNNLGNTLNSLGRVGEAEASYRRTLELKPDYAEAHSNLGATLRTQGRFSDAEACYRKAQELGSHGARIRTALTLPSIMGTWEEVLESRATFERNLDELIIEAVPLDDPMKDVGETNFYLAYHGLNDRDLQVKVAKYYEQACPSLLYTAPHCAKPKTSSQERIRIGFLSMFLFNHAVSHCFSKIIEALSLKSQFDVTLISSRSVDKNVYSEFTGGYLHLPSNLERAREMVASLELDILVYTDIGMEPWSYFLAFSRLARAQCVLAGHPVTTGITNIDYFLSNKLMETHGAEKHYSEKLILLPRPPVYFARPVLPATLRTRHELGLPEGRHVYMCPTRLQKIHPDFDEAIARILQIDDNATVVLFEDMVIPFGKAYLVKRFEKTIPLETRERIIFLPWLKDMVDFISAIATADVILDPFHFGIGSTAIMIFATNTPLVTRPTELMRGRVGAGLCNILNITECIAEDTESYAQKAFKIASSKPLREKISAQILRNSSLFYENLQPVEDLVDFFHSLTDRQHIA